MRIESAKQAPSWQPHHDTLTTAEGACNDSSQCRETRHLAPVSLLTLDISPNGGHQNSAIRWYRVWSIDRESHTLPKPRHSSLKRKHLIYVDFLPLALGLIAHVCSVSPAYSPTHRTLVALLNCSSSYLVPSPSANTSRLLIPISVPR